MKENKYENLVRKRAEELAKVFDPSLYNRLKASYGTNPVYALNTKENKKLRTQVTRLEEKMIPAARLSVQRETKPRECWTLEDCTPCSDAEKDDGRCGCNPGGRKKETTSTVPHDYPGKAYQTLFDHLQKQHGVTLLESEMYEIVEIVRKMDSQWISVEDGLPDKGCYVFLWDQFEGRDIGYYDGSIFINKEDGRERKYVTHFYEFPAPPESLTDKT